MFEELLHTIAQVAVTMAGFSGVTYALGNRAGRVLDDREKSGITHMLLPSFGSVIISLLAITLLSSTLSEPVAWRISCAIAGVYVIGGASKATLDMLNDQTSMPKFVAWPVNIGGEVFGIFNVLIAVGLFQNYADVGLVSLLIFLLFVSMVSFASLLTENRAGS